MNSRGVITRGMVLLASIILFAVIGTVIAIMVGKNKNDDRLLGEIFSPSSNSYEVDYE